MPKRTDPELPPEEQYKLFKEAAEKAGVTESEEEFEGAFKAVAPARKKADQGRQRLPFVEGCKVATRD
jgi:hypothetical protein